MDKAMYVTYLENAIQVLETVPFRNEPGHAKAPRLEGDLAKTKAELDVTLAMPDLDFTERYREFEATLSPVEAA